MEWIGFITTLSILFLLCVLCRVFYIKGYRSGAKKVIAEWRETLETEGDDHIG